MLQSPTFLYLDEPKDSAGKLDGHGVASRLAISLWDSNPDSALLQAATNGELDSAEGVRQHARAMLADPRSKRGLGTFVSQWLDANVTELLERRPDLAALGSTVTTAMDQEPVGLFSQVVTSGGSLKDLFTTSLVPTHSALQSLYGADIVSTSAQGTQLNPKLRSGLLTLPGVMASLAHPGSTSPTLRGKIVMGNLFCRPPSPPPPGVDTSLPAPTSADATMRERLQAHVLNPVCAGCHRQMDGIGFAFEKLDELGRSRTTEKNKPIDDRGELVLAQILSVTGAVELSHAVAERPELGACFARQWALYAAGAPEQPEVACYLDHLAPRLNEAGGLSELIVELAASDYLTKGVDR